MSENQFEVARDIFTHLRDAQPDMEMAREDYTPDRQVLDFTRLRALRALEVKYHDVYLNLSRYRAQRQHELVDGCFGLYIPNVMSSVPILLDTIEGLKEQNQRLIQENIQLKEQKNEAYKRLNLKISNYHETMPVDKDALYDDYTQNKGKRKSRKKNS